MVLDPDHETKWPSLAYRATTRQKPELPSLSSLRSLCLRILSSRPPVEAASSTKAHEDRTLNRSSRRSQRKWYLILTMRRNGRRLPTGQQLGKNRNSLL